MCRSWLVVVLLSLRAILLPAQDAAQWRKATQKADAEYRAFRDSMVQGDSTIREVARKDDLVLSSSENLRRVAQAAFDRLVQIRERWFGGQSPSPAGFRIVLREQRSDTDQPGRSEGLMVLSGLPDSGSAVRMDRIVPRDQIENALVDLFGEMMFSSLPAAIQSWLGGSVPLSMRVSERKHLAMYAVATGTGLSQRACLAGGAADCLYVLGLGSAPRKDAGGVYAGFLRSDVLFSVLELRSDGWERLRRSPAGEPIAVLANAANTPAESLIRYWLETTLSSRPTDGPLRTAAGLSAIGWIGVLLLAALLGGRSRWV